MKTVSPNFIMLTLRLILFPCFVLMVVVPIAGLVDNDYVGEEGITLIGLFFFIFFLAFVFWSLLGVFKIKYEEDTGKITFHRLYSSRTISIEDIVGYYQSTLKTRWKNYNGYILLLNDGSTVELTEYNVRPLRNFYAFIVKSGVPCKGTKDSWYPLKRRLRTT